MQDAKQASTIPLQRSSKQTLNSGVYLIAQHGGRKDQPWGMLEMAIKASAWVVRILMLISFSDL